MGYDMHIVCAEDWAQLERDGLDVIIDPVVLRVGQFFLEGAPDSEREQKQRWGVIESDLGALVEFFDLVVLRDRFPAFNWHDTYDGRLDFGDALGNVLNAGGDHTLVHVDVEHDLYRAAKDAAIELLSQRIDEGPFIAQAQARDLLAMLDSLGYDWNPSLESLQDKVGRDPDAARVAKFLLGQLVFAGYAQQTGAPHILSTTRSRLVAALGVNPRDATREAESAIFDEVRRRCREAGPSWRDSELPWTPSFLPLLTQGHTDGPATLLRRAKDLRTRRSVEEYRTLRRGLVGSDPDADAAREQLAHHADAVSEALETDRRDLEITRKYAVEYVPKVLGKVAPIAGAALDGPVGATVGVALGQIAEDVLSRANAVLFGWVLGRLPFRSARKLLSRAVRAETELQATLAPALEQIWRRPD